MIPGGFGRRVGLSMAAVVVAALASAGAALSVELRMGLSREAARQLAVQAGLAALRVPPSALAPGMGQDEARALAKACGCRATLVAADGRLAGDSELDGSGLARAENHADRPEIASALAGTAGSHERHSATVDLDMLYAAAPVIKEGRVAGAARLSRPLLEVERQVGRARAVVLWTMLGALAAALAAAAWLARGVARPVARMAEAAARISAGEYSARVRPLPGDELGLLGGALNELAARVQATVGELSRGRAQLEAVLDQMQEGVVAVDAQGSVLLINPALSRLLGADPAASRGRPYLETLRHHELATLLGDVLARGESAAQELRLFVPEELVFDAHAAPLLQDGRPAGALLVLHDITRTRRLESLRREFVANVSHELRTPLASIKGYAETLLAGALDDREHRADFVRTIEERAESLTKLVDDLLDLSAIESGHRPPRLGSVDLAALARESARDFAAAAAARRLSLTVSAEGLPPVDADREQLRQVLANLLDNALKYTEPGGRVELAVRREGGRAELVVSDSGAGIPEADLPRVFERFYRVDKARSREAGGTGLGLAIVKHIVEAHGGTVSVRSRVGEGSVFLVSLPLA